MWHRVIWRLLYALNRHRISVLALLVLGLGLGTYQLWRTTAVDEVSASGTLPIEVAVQNIQQQGSNFALTLKEKNGTRRIAMNINGPEALVIARQQGLRVPGETLRAYDLMRDLVRQTGGRVERVIVNDADQQQYYAEVVVTSGSETRVIKARPSDAVALAMTAGAPIYVEDRVLDKFGVKGST